MGYLYMTLVLAAWTAVAFVYRWADKKGANRMFMGLAMGVAGTFWALVYVYARGIDLRQAAAGQVAVGVALSLLAVTGIPIFMAAVARGDLSITWTVMSLSFALASVMSMVWPGERVTGLAVAGLVLAAAAVILLGLDMYERHRGEGPNKPRKGWTLFVGISFFTNALSMYCYKVAEQLQPDPSPVHTATFLLVMYTLFAVWSLPVALWTRRSGSAKAGLGIGLVGGSLLLGGGLFSMFSFGEGVPGCVLFPATTGGSNVCVAALSFIFLGERPGRWGWLGMGLGLAAIVCLGLGMK